MKSRALWTAFADGLDGGDESEESEDPGLTIRFLAWETGES